jgi:alpha-galactosidase
MMNDAKVRARTDDGGRVTVAGAGGPLSDTGALLVEVDGRSISGWEAPDSDGDSISGLLTGTRVHAEWRARRIAEQDVWEFTLRLRNDGDVPVAITRMDPLRLHVEGEWRTLGYRSAWGDEFRPVTGWTSHDLVLESRAGRSSNGHDPYLGLEREGAAIAVLPAWSGNWHIHALAEGHVTAGISPWRFRVDLAPGEELEAPSVVVAVAGDLDEAAVAVQRAVAGDWLPRTPWTDQLPLEWNHWWPYEDVEVTEQIIAENAALAADLGFDVATVDAGWFGAADAGSDWQEQRGDWGSVNSARFPSGLEALGDSIRDAGLAAGMWIEAEAVGRSSKLRAERPELLALSDGTRPDPSYRFMTVSVDADDPTFLGYVCLGSEAGRDHVLTSVSRLIERTGSRWIKLDFNIDPDAGCRRTDHGHGEGDGLYRHYLGLYNVLDELRARHPEIVLESCASGGLRIDLGLARHVHAFFLSDPDYTEHHLQVLWGVRRVLPPVGILHWSWSQWRGEHPASQRDWANLPVAEFDRMLRAAMVHRFGASLRLPELRPDLLERLRVHLALYRDVLTPVIRDGVLRPLTESPARGGRGERAPAIQLTGSSDRHVVLAVTLDGGVRRAVVHPVALDPAARYRVTDLATGAATEATGAELLADGIPLAGDPAVCSWLVAVDPA